MDAFKSYPVNRCENITMYGHWQFIVVNNKLLLLFEWMQDQQSLPVWYDEQAYG